MTELLRDVELSSTQIPAYLGFFHHWVAFGSHVMLTPPENIPQISWCTGYFYANLTKASQLRGGRLS